MSLYTVALFVHIVGAVLIFVLLAIEGVGIWVGFSAAPINRVLGPISALAILVPGLYMVASGPGWRGWNVVGLVSYGLIAVLGAYTGIALMRGRMSAQAATFSWLARIGLALGVLFDMTIKPDLLVSILAVLVATLAGAGFVLAVRPRREVQRA